MEMIDLRSDTVTKPSAGMRQAMMAADVGDDVYGEDPSVNALQQRVAAMFGKEAGLFVPSGTMGNEVCVKLHTQPGDEIILEEEAHIGVYETAGPSFLSGVQMHPVRGTHGIITAEQVEEAIRPAAYYLPRTTLLCLENTHGRSAGSVIPLEMIRKISDVCGRHGIKMHLDGARIWNACIASGVSPETYSSFFDTVSVCFSKGLGAPVGSMILGSVQDIERARVYRKLFGGGMRQAGILAAAALYALDHHYASLAEDHAKAQLFARMLSQHQVLSIDPDEVQTNMVFVDVRKTGKSQAEVLAQLKEQRVLMTPERSTSLRAVMHRDVTIDQVESAAEIFSSLVK